MDVWQGVIVAAIFLALGAAGTYLAMRGWSAGHRLRAEEAAAERTAARAELDRVAELRREAEVRLASAEERAAQADAIKAELAEVESEKEEVERALAQRREDESRLRAELEAKEESLRSQKEMLDETEAKMKDAFENLAAKALSASAEDLVKRSKERQEEMEKSSQTDLAERQRAVAALMEPFKEKLDRLEAFNRDLEKSREGAYEQIKTQIIGLQEDQRRVAHEANRLARALQNPGTAGSWGEVTLQRVVEMAGLDKHVHFTTQQSHETDEGRKRPDMIVMLPGGRSIVIDAKAPFRSYADALEAEEPMRSALMATHAQKVLERANELRRKGYGEELAETPDFTVLFIPSEGAFRAAVEARPSLMEEAMERNVVVASPATLLGLLRAVHYGWRQERLAAEAKEIQKEGAELYARIVKLADHYQKLGKGLQGAVKAYNEFGGSLERSLLPAARRMRERGISGKEEPAEPPAVEFTPRQLQAEDFTRALPGGEAGELPGLE